MDESNPQQARKRRSSNVPVVEALEGRRLMAASALGQVGIKEVALQGYSELDLTGTSKGDSIAIVDDGSDAVGNVTVHFGDGTSYTTRSGVSVVRLQDGSGADNVSFDLTGPLVASQSVLINLGGGNNHFTANIAGAINTANGLDLEVYGGAGNDAMVVNQAGATLAGAFVPYFMGGGGKNVMVYNGTGNIAAGASVSPEFGGGNGTNTIQSNYSGQINGNYMYNLSVDAGSGDETIVNNILIGAGSTGLVGVSPTSPAAIKLGKGADKVQFQIEADPTSTAQINAVIVGASGKDVITHTPNVILQGKSARTKEIIVG